MQDLMEQIEQRKIEPREYMTIQTVLEQGEFIHFDMRFDYFVTHDGFSFDTAIEKDGQLLFWIPLMCNEEKQLKAFVATFYEGKNWNKRFEEE